MRVLVCQRPGGAFAYISDGWINALRSKGHKAERWDGREESWFDYCPDLYIGCSGHKQPIPSIRNTKIALHVNPYGPTKIKGIDEHDDTIRWVINQKPDLVFGYGTENDRFLWSYWTQKHGINWIPMPTAGDKTIYKETKEEDKIYDIIYLGGRWPYKALTIDQYLIPALRQSKSFKLCGWGDWPSNMCAGPLAEAEVSEFLGSGRIGPCISEKHTHEYLIDVPERAFKIALSNTLIIHDPALAVKRMIPSAVIAKDSQQFIKYCEYYCTQAAKNERIELTRQQRNEVLMSHTYHHRMSIMLRELGYNKEAADMVK